ncbi:sensor histidine kinase, partial [Pseudoalteromonas sp. S1731]
AFAWEKVAYIPLGMRTNDRGSYITQAIYNNNQAEGVEVLKVNVKKIERERELLNTGKGSHFYEQLEDSLIAISEMENC